MFFSQYPIYLSCRKEKDAPHVGYGSSRSFFPSCLDSRMSCGQGHRNLQENCIFCSGRVKTDTVLRIIAGNKAFSRTVVGSVRCNALSASLHS